MFCTIVEEELLALVNAADYTSCLARPDTTEIGFTGKPIKTMVYVWLNGFDSNDDLVD